MTRIPRPELPGEFRMLIGGEWVAPAQGEYFPTVCPADGEVIAHVPDGQAADVDRAVQAAHQAFPAWRKIGLVERVTLMRKAAARIRQNAEQLAAVESLDSGNPYRAMLNDIQKAAGAMEYLAGISMELKGETFPGTPGVLNFTTREPYGVVARIIPFNHPAMFAIRGIAGPLLAGNTVVLKPAEQTPLSALCVGKLLQDLFPPGVVNIVTGKGASAGAALVQHPLVRRIAFTGSRATGKAIMSSAPAHTLKHVSLELGGKNPMVVFPDADLDRAVRGAVQGMNFNVCAGQSCGSNTRLFLHDTIYDEFTARLTEQLEQIRLGHPLDEECEMGPVISDVQCDRILKYVAIGQLEGAKLLTGGRAQDPAFAGGYYIRPTLFAEVKNGMAIAQEEIFGPVMTALRWHDSEQMLHEANDTIYGLTASVWSRDISVAHRTAEALEAGYVWINQSERRYPGTPFGGFKESGLGRENCLEELVSYTQTKLVSLLL